MQTGRQANPAGWRYLPFSAARRVRPDFKKGNRMSKRKTPPAKAADSEQAGLTAWANIAVVANKFQNAYWPNLLQQCKTNGITSDANYWIEPIMGSMQDLFGKIVWQPRLLEYLRRVHGINNREALGMSLTELAELLWQDAQQSGGGTTAPPAVWAEIEANLDTYMGDWKKSLLDHLEKQPPATGGSQQGEGAAGKRQKRKRRQRGRKRGEYDETRDQKIYAAYATLNDYGALAEKFGIATPEARLIVKRHRARERRVTARQNRSKRR